MFTHISKDGREYRLAEMETTHLINSARVFLRKFKLAKNVLQGTPLNRFEKLIYGQSAQFTEDDAERYIEYFTDRFPHYILELLVRDYEVAELIADYQEIIQRTVQLSDWTTEVKELDRTVEGPYYCGPTF